MSLYLSLHFQKLLFTSYIHEDGCPPWVIPRHCSSFGGFTMNCCVTQGLCTDQALCTCLYFQGGVWLSLCLGLRSWQRCLSSSSWCYLCRLQPCRAPAGAAPTGTTRVQCKICKGLPGATRATCDLCTPRAGSNRVGCEPWQPQLASPEFQRLPTSTPGLDGPMQSEPGASGICFS